MKFGTPDDLRTALSPTVYFNWIVGMGVCLPPRSKLIRIPMVLYSWFFWIFNVVLSYFGLTTLTFLYFYNRSSMVVIMYQTLIYTNSIVALIMPLLAISRHKALVDCIERLGKLDDVFAKTLNMQKDYKVIVVGQIYQIIIIGVIIGTITIIDGIWLNSNTSIFTDIAISTTFHHPILLMLVTDFTFCWLTKYSGLVSRSRVPRSKFVDARRYVGKKFRELNTAMLNLVDTNTYLYPRRKIDVVPQKVTQTRSVFGSGNIERILRGSENKRFLFQTIRKSHLELSKVAGKLNSAFGAQNLISMAVSLVMITGLLYTMYSSSTVEVYGFKRISDMLPPLSWAVIYALKILVVSHTCASVSDEARKSGEIIYEVLDSAVDKEFQKEIQQFALQLMQNPVQFTACGFFTMDYTFVQGVIGSITTYLVILIQMSNVSTPAATPPTNGTTNCTARPN